MPNQILQVDENMLETKLDRLVSEKVEQLLNAMLDAEADEITGACRRSYTLECKTNAARRALEGEPLARVARDAGCTPTSVYQWMRRYRSEGILGLMDRRNAPMPAEPNPVLRFAIRLLPGSRIRASLRAERTAGTFWTFLACQREDSSTRWKNWMLIEEYGCE